MRSIIGEYLSDTKALTRFHTQKAGGGTGFGNPLGMSGAASGVNLGRQTNLTQHTEQYRHYNGWVSASIGPIGKRIARQPFRLARVKSAQPDGSTPGAPPSPSVPKPMPSRPTPSGSKVTFTTGHVQRKVRKPWEHPTNPWEVAKNIWFKKALPGCLKSYFETAELIDAHPFLDALEDPNPIMVRWSLIFVTVASLLLTGKAYWWIKARERDGEPSHENPSSFDRVKIDIWPVPSNWVSPVHRPDKLFDHWEIRPEGTITPTPVPAAQIVYFFIPDPGNPLGAHSTLQSQARAVVSDEAIAEAQRRGFANGVFPGLAFIVGRQPDINGAVGERPAMTKEQKAQLITAIKQAHRGVYNADEPIILDRIIEDVKRISNTNREMDFMESGKYTKDRITQGFGVNPITMGQVEGANRASSATADDHLCANSVNPLIELISETLTAWMGPIFAAKGEKLLLFMEEAYAIDPDSERADWNLLVTAGACQRDELRAGLKGLPPIRDGDQCFVPQGQALIDCSRLADGTEIDGYTGRSGGVSPKSSEPNFDGDYQLDVGDLRQDYPYDCGACAARMVSDFAGLEDCSEQEFMVKLKTDETTGTTLDNIFDYFDWSGCDPYAKDRRTVDNLKREIRRGRPVLCVIQYIGDGDALGAEGGEEPSGHWVVVTGYTKDTIRYNDPIDGPSEVSYRQWLDNWHDRSADGRSLIRFGISVGPAPELQRSVLLANTKPGQRVRVRAAGDPDKLLPVPDVPQPDNYSCGACATCAVGRMFEVGPTDVEEWKNELHTTREASTLPEAIVSFMSELGCQVQPKHGMTLDDLSACWRAGTPVLIPLQEYGVPTKQTSAEYGHWVVFIGRAFGYVFVQDPSVDNVLADQDSDNAPGRMMIEEQKFLDVWHDVLDGNEYIRFGIIVGPPNIPPDTDGDPVPSPSQPDQPNQPRSGRYQAKAHYTTLDERGAEWIKAHDTGSASLKTAVMAFFAGERKRIFGLLDNTLKAGQWQYAAPLTKDSDRENGVDGDEDRDSNLDAVLGNLCPIGPMTRRLRLHIVDPLTELAESGAQQETDMIVPAKSSEVNAWLKAGKPVDRKPLPANIRERVNDYLGEMVEEPYWDDINKTTRLKLARAIRRGLAHNEGPESIADRIRHALSETEDSLRADLIARTEATAAINLGMQASRESLGPKYVKGKQWQCTPDDHTRDTHRKADGQYRRVGTQFTVGGCRCSFPGDPALPATERCRCRCAAFTIPSDSTTAPPKWVEMAAVKVTDSSGHEHDQSGRFGHGSGGGAHDHDKPKPKPAGGSGHDSHDKPGDKPSGGSHDTANSPEKPEKPKQTPKEEASDKKDTAEKGKTADQHPPASGKDTGHINDGPEALGKKADGLLGKLKSWGARAANVAKGVGQKAWELAHVATYHLAKAKVVANDVLDDTQDYANIYNAGKLGGLGGTSSGQAHDWLTSHIGIGGNCAMVIASHALAFGICKLKQALGMKSKFDKPAEPGKGSQPWLKDDDSPPMAMATRAHIMAETLAALLPELGCPTNELPSADDILKWLKTRPAKPTGEQ